MARIHVPVAAHQVQQHFWIHLTSPELVHQHIISQSLVDHLSLDRLNDVVRVGVLAVLADLVPQILIK